ncbi:MAG: flagellar basal body P-ring protein FlgI [Sedimentisphaerales bacterium]|nr:flagellar basal body P-ring protein FlgI [Sedimentisphaerales bacterium]
MLKTVLNTKTQRRKQKTADRERITEAGCLFSVFCLLFSVLILALLSGCGGPRKQATQKQPKAQDELGPTIGSLVEIFASEPIAVKGYSLIGGLNGAGSSECPPQIRRYLEKYILQHVSGAKVNIDELINSPDTSVVTVEGIIPPAASKNQRFDVRVSALPGTQTTSLEGGWLYGADLYEARQLGLSIKALAGAEGPVYIDSISSEVHDPRSGFVLGGGSVLEEYEINLVLRKPDYRIASQIRNRINERFEYDTAWALAPGNIELRVPVKYARTKEKFIRLIRATYLAEIPELAEKRIETQISNLVTSSNKNSAEIALEAIGNACLPRLATLLDSNDPEVRFRAARCMFNLGNPKGREAIFNTAGDKKSPFRVEAIESIVGSAASPDTSSMLRGLLRDDDFSVRLTAYENLARINDVMISRNLIANSFYLDQITDGGKPAIFVSRQSQPRVALFGSPIYCQGDIFVETPDGSVTINAPADQQVVTIIRKHPRHPDKIIRLNCSLNLADIIQTLCKEPQAQPGESGPGLGVPYSTLAMLLKQLADAGAVSAEFHSSPPPKTLPNIKK